MPEEKEVHEFYKHYRGAAVALSATIIVVSGTIVFQLENRRVTDWAVLLQIISGIAILTALFMQFFHFLGYIHLARSFFGQSTVETSNIRFCWLDRFTIVSFCFSVAGLAIYAGILFLPKICRLIVN